MTKLKRVVVYRLVKIPTNTPYATYFIVFDWNSTIYLLVNVSQMGITSALQ